jgi:hypothetical protein
LQNNNPAAKIIYYPNICPEPAHKLINSGKEGHNVINALERLMQISSTPEAPVLIILSIDH